MKKFILALLVLYVGAMMISAQQSNSCGAKTGLVLSKSKPTIYITFESTSNVKRVPARLAATETSAGQRNEENDESFQAVWLRLHNNTRWAINFATDSLYVGSKIMPIRLCDGRGALGLRTDIEVNARYELEAVADYESMQRAEGGLVMNSSLKPPVINRSDMFSTSWLPSGGSVIFSVPYEHLAERLAIYIPYNYEWEYSKRTIRSDEPQHRVYFRASDLPEKIQVKIKRSFLNQSKN